jgi:hypothetical protein
LALRESTSQAIARIAGLMVNSIQEYEQQTGRLADRQTGETGRTRPHNPRLPLMVADQVKGG